MPVVIMGETGCGKSSLISGMCAVLGWTLNVLNVHNGLSYNAIVEWIGEQASACFSDETRTSVIFLDEINACCSVGEAIESFGGEEKACNLFLLYCSFPLSVVFLKDMRSLMYSSGCSYLTLLVILRRRTLFLSTKVPRQILELHILGYV